MKPLMILGAIIGFLIGASFGLAAGSQWPTALWRACAAALFAAILSRWWGRIWISGLKESLEERRRGRPHTAAAFSSAKPAPATKQS